MDDLGRRSGLIGCLAQPSLFRQALRSHWTRDLPYLVTCGTLPAGQATRLDVFLAQQLRACSRAKVASYIKDGLVAVNGRPQTKSSFIVKEGQELTCTIPPPKPSSALPEVTACRTLYVLAICKVSAIRILGLKTCDHLPKPVLCVFQDIPLDIVYEDEHLLVVNKPAGMVMHPCPGHMESGTLVNALLHRWQLPPIVVDAGPLGQAPRPGQSLALAGSVQTCSHMPGLPRFAGPYSVVPVQSAMVPPIRVIMRAGPLLNIQVDIAESDASADDEEQSDISWVPPAQAMQALRPGIVHRLDKGTTGTCGTGLQYLS